jgi:maltose-binding protein MalE
MSKKFLTLISVMLIAVFVLAACAPAATPTAVVEPTAAPVEPTAAPVEPTVAPTEAAPAATLRVWADDTRAPVLQDIAPAFMAEYGVELVVELKSSIRDDFQNAAPTGEGPDIIVIAHDQAGTLVANGLLAPVDLGEKADLFVENAKSACTFDGILYCMPYATENPVSYTHLTLPTN